jgi:hypothetical protein
MRTLLSGIDQDFFTVYLPRLGSLNLMLLDCVPDFFVISPPKTGTTWLAENLRQHPEVFIPEEKELHYFSAYWRHFDINWYLRFFQSVRHLIKGEVSTGYGALPQVVVQWLYRLNPRLKLIYLMRHPVERTWSHAKHQYKHTSFSIRDHEYPIISNDKALGLISPSIHFHSNYLRDIQCWLSVFPKEQMFIGFYEAIRDRPEQLLADLFAYLEARPITDWSRFPLSAVIHPGIEKGIPPHVELVLCHLYQRMTRELAQFLREEFGLELPLSWQSITREKTITDAEIVNLLFRQEKEYEQYIPKAYDHFFDLTITDPAFVPPLNYKGFRVAFMAPQWYAFSPSLENRDWRTLDHQTLSDYVSKGECFNGDSLEEVKRLIEIAAHQSAPELIESGYREFNLVAYRGRIYGLALSLGPIDLPKLEKHKLDEYLAQGQYLVADSLEGIKRLIDHLMTSHISA